MCQFGWRCLSRRLDNFDHCCLVGDKKEQMLIVLDPLTCIWAQTISTSLGTEKPGSVETSSLEIRIKTPPSVPLARFFLNMVYPGGQISESGIMLVSQDSIPIITSACVASRRFSICTFLPTIDRQFTTTTLRGMSCRPFFFAFRPISTHDGWRRWDSNLHTSTVESRTLPLLRMPNLRHLKI